MEIENEKLLNIQINKYINNLYHWGGLILLLFYKHINVIYYRNCK